MKLIIPGHARVFTFPLALTLAIIALVITGSWMRALGSAFIIFGAFLGDQATHLAQMDHSTEPPTWFERQQQRRRPLFVILGFCVAMLGTWMALYVPAY